MNRRNFMRASIAGSLYCLAGDVVTLAARAGEPRLISPGCRKSKVKVARLYLGVPKAHYPNPAIDLNAERKDYEARFRQFGDELADVDFVVDELVGTPPELAPLKDRLRRADGILAIHLTLRTLPVMKELLSLGRPTTIFSAPYSGHEWFNLAEISRSEAGRKLECILTTDDHELVAAIRPFRALHHLREARILNLADAHRPKDYPARVKAKFGTDITLVTLDRMMKCYEAISDRDARAEAKSWTERATAVVEPSAEEIFKSCKLALAFERLLDEEEATVMTVDCYGSMWRKVPAYPCIGFARLNDLGLGGICQSDLPCAMMHIIFQGLSGRPGFACNPTFDFGTDSTTLIHCLGCTKMDGPAGQSAPYKLRSVMEREEGAVPQVFMRVGTPVTQSILADMSTLRYFTGKIIGAPDTDRGCRTKIQVRLDGSTERLWRNWTAGIHRVSCYGTLTRDLQRFGRFADLQLVDEAA